MTTKVTYPPIGLDVSLLILDRELYNRTSDELVSFSSTSSCEDSSVPLISLALDSQCAPGAVISDSPGKMVPGEVMG